MKALLYLVLRKTIGVIRGWFRKLVSAILTIVALLFFVFTIGSLILNPVAIDGFDFVLIGGVVSALFLFIFGISLLSKKKALVFQNDASFVLAGPFTRKQVLGYVLLNNTMQNIWITLGLVGYILLFLGSSIANIQQLLWLMVVAFSAGMLMMVVSSLDYVLEKGYERYFKIKVAVLIGYALVFLGLIIPQLLRQPISFELIGVVATSKTLFAFPFIGWILGAFYYAGIGSWGMAWLFVFIMIITTFLVSVLFFNNKVDFYEQAIFDAERTHVLMSKAKEGTSEDVILFNKKLKQKSGNFRSGAMALWSSYVLQQKKTGQFLKPSELIFFVMYTFIAYMSKEVLTYRILIGMTVFFTINSDTLRYELKRPFVYLIPETSFRKMLVLMIPMLYRAVLLTSLGGIATVFLFGLSISDALLFVFSLVGISLALISGTALTLHLLKGQKNPIVEQFLRMLVILVVLIPSIVVVVIVSLSVVPIDSPSWIGINSMVVFVMNVFVSLLIIKISSSLLHGNDMFAS